MTHGNNKISERCPSEVPIEIDGRGRDIIPDQGLIAMNICKQKNVDQRVYCDTLQLSQWDFFSLLGGGVARVEGRYKMRGRRVGLGRMMWNSQRTNKISKEEGGGEQQQQQNNSSESSTVKNESQAPAQVKCDELEDLSD